jgi:hypothetical protein
MPERIAPATEGRRDKEKRRRNGCTGGALWWGAGGSKYRALSVPATERLNVL